MDKQRADILNSVIGLPWVANARGPDAYDCYHLTRYIQKAIFNRDLPDIDVPNSPGWRFVIDTLRHYTTTLPWREVCDASGLVTAQDGAFVALAASTRPAHVGTWFRAERSILHVDHPDGVCFHDLQTVKMLGWQRMVFFEPAVGA